MERLNVNAGVSTLTESENPITKESYWLANRDCPACGCEKGVALGRLPITHYKFGHEYIRLPDNGISLIQCNNCSLIYKTTVPSQFYLSKIFTREAHHKWTDKYNFVSEKKLIRNLVDKKSFDLLDIGPYKGGLLKICSDLSGRRSCLDIIKYPYLDNLISDEFIHGLIDDLELKWSHNPYDVVALFDVLEHFYNPEQAFRNLRNLAKDYGYIVIETGNADSVWPRKFGISNWWYVNLFEHHVFWTEKSLRFMADKFGFEIVHMVRKTHKACKWSSGIFHIKNLWKVGFYILSPKVYKWAAQIIGKQDAQPWCLYSNNHLRAVLVKSKKTQ